MEENTRKFIKPWWLSSPFSGSRDKWADSMRVASGGPSSRRQEAGHLGDLLQHWHNTGSRFQQ